MPSARNRLLDLVQALDNLGPAPSLVAVAHALKRAVPDLFVVGTLRKPASWESTAVPELRQQAAAAAEGVLSWLAQRRPRASWNDLAVGLPEGCSRPQAP